MKHLIYAAVSVSSLCLATGAFAACGAQHTASLANGNIVVAQQYQAPAIQTPVENQDNSVTTDENKSDE